MPFRLLWGHNPSFYDTNTMAVPGLWRSLNNCAIDATGGYGGSGALIFDESTSGVVYGSQDISEDPNMAAKWPKFIPDNVQLMIGSRFWMGANPAATVPIFIVINPEGFAQFSLCVDTSGYLSVWRGIPYLTHGLHAELWNAADSDLEPLDLSTWQRVGLIAYISPVNGWFDVYLGRDAALPATHIVYKDGLKTNVHDISQWSGVGYGGSEDMKHSHMYFGSGIPAYTARVRRGGFLSNVGVSDTDGAYSGWTSSEATIHQAIDEQPPDDDATVIEGPDVAAQFSVKRVPLVGTRQILGVMSSARYHRQTDSPYALRQLIAVNDVVYPATTIAADAPETFAYDQVLSLVDPSNGLPFTRARLNSITEFGAVVHGPPA